MGKISKKEKKEKKEKKRHRHSVESRVPAAVSAPPGSWQNVPEEGASVENSNDPDMVALRTFAGAGPRAGAETGQEGTVKAQVEYNHKVVSFTLSGATTLSEIAQMYGQWVVSQQGNLRK